MARVSPGNPVPCLIGCGERAWGGDSRTFTNTQSVEVLKYTLTTRNSTVRADCHADLTWRPRAHRAEGTSKILYFSTTAGENEASQFS